VNPALNLILEFIGTSKGTMRARSVDAAIVRMMRLVTVSVLVMGASSAGVRAQVPAAAKPLPILTHVDQIRSLSPEQASLGYPVLVRGVITMDAPAPDFFVQDATAGIYVEGSVSARFPHLLSQVVEVEGVTGPGKFAPVIRETKLRVVEVDDAFAYGCSRNWTSLYCSRSHAMAAMPLDDGSHSSLRCGATAANASEGHARLTPNAARPAAAVAIAVRHLMPAPGRGGGARAAFALVLVRDRVHR